MEKKQQGQEKKKQQEKTREKKDEKKETLVKMVESQVKLMVTPMGHSVFPHGYLVARIEKMTTAKVEDVKKEGHTKDGIKSMQKVSLCPSLFISFFFC